MTKPNRRAASPALVVLLWLVAVLVFAGFSAGSAIQRASAELEATGRTLHRQISQRVAQHDAHLTSLVALATAVTPPSEAPIKQVATSITRFYPRIAGIFLVAFDGEPAAPGLETLVSVAPVAGNPDFSAVAAAVMAQKQGEVRSYASSREPRYYLLAKRVPGVARNMAFILQVDAGLLVEPEERPGWARLTLALGGKTVLERPAEITGPPASFLPTPRFEKVVDSESQPLVVRVERALSLAEIIQPRGLLAFALLSLLTLLVVQFAWRQRADARAAQTAAVQAEQRARLREHETRLAHASRVNAMGELASGMAHELTQPLTALLSQSQAALRMASTSEPDLATMTKVLGDNVREAKRAGAMLERIRAYVSNRQPEPVRTGLNPIVSDMVALTSPDLAKRGILVSVVLGEREPEAIVDAIEMEQVLYNLLRNAADALEAAGTADPWIAVETTSSDTEVSIIVEDNGPGIPDGVLPRLFEPFFTTKQTGMGLGLSLCETLVERVDGRIEVANGADGGARFVVTLPAARRQMQAAQ